MAPSHKRTLPPAPTHQKYSILTPPTNAFRVNYRGLVFL